MCLTTGAASNWEITWWRKAAKWAGLDLSCSILLKQLHWPFVCNTVRTKAFSLPTLQKGFVLNDKNTDRGRVRRVKSCPWTVKDTVPAPGLNQSSRPQLQWFVRRCEKMKDCWLWLGTSSPEEKKVDRIIGDMYTKMYTITEKYTNTKWTLVLWWRVSTVPGQLCPLPLVSNRSCSCSWGCSLGWDRMSPLDKQSLEIQVQICEITGGGTHNIMLQV